MTNLISGKEALIALANGEEVQIESNKQWVSVENCQVYQFLYKNCDYKFRIKPRTITINGIEVPAPFLPDEGELFFHIAPEHEKGYARSLANERNETTWQQFGAWRSENEIKQVVAALRQVFGGV